MKETEDYRINANLALQAALNRHLALRLVIEEERDRWPGLQAPWSANAEALDMDKSSL